MDQTVSKHSRWLEDGAENTTNGHMPHKGPVVSTDESEHTSQTMDPPYHDGDRLDANHLKGKLNGCRTPDVAVNSSPPNIEAVNGSLSEVETTEMVIPGAGVPIAICGMAFRLPAGLSTSQQLWDFLYNKCDARGKVPESRYNVSAFYDPQGKPGSVITDHGYFLDDDIACLDTSFFSMARMEVERLDPQQRLMLEVSRECFEDAGVTDWRAKNIGCYMGSLFEDWCEIFARETQNWGRYRVTGYGDFVLSNRVSYEMDLKGPRSLPYAYASS
ncbi:MAG: hypothetical protein Q9172_001246 [Xanthocarpia lactea]